jgi:DNA-binding LacI/PurR family transcriptional regulator
MAWLYPAIGPRDPRVTSIDVARRAGVSQSTVSLVFSGKGRGRVSPATEATVRAAAEELGYRPNEAARALRTGAARTVGLAVPDITHPFFGSVMRGAAAAAREAGFSVVLVDVTYDPELEIASVEALRSGAVDGMLFFTVDPPPAPGLPSVAIEVEPEAMPSVRFDVEGGVDAALEHLRELGHSRIGHLTSAIPAQTFQRRAARWDAGDARVPAEFTFEAAAQAAGLLLDGPGPTAVLCDDDVLAGGVYLAARERGLTIPGDVSVVGFDDLPFARVLDPPLTSVRIDGPALGATAFRTLAAVMAGEPHEPRTVLPVDLAVRESTARR